MCYLFSIYSKAFFLIFWSSSWWRVLIKDPGPCWSEGVFGRWGRPCCLIVRSAARLAPVSQPVLSSALWIRGLFRNEPLCMGIMWDIWASAYCSMTKVKACPPHSRLPSPPHHLRTQTAAKLTFHPLWTSSHLFGRTVFFKIEISVYWICQQTLIIKISHLIFPHREFYLVWDYKAKINTSNLFFFLPSHWEKNKCSDISKYDF